MILKWTVYIVTLCFLVSCHTSETKNSQTISKEVKLGYAKRFKVKKNSQFVTLQLLGNKTNNNVTATFILYKNEKPLADKDAYYIKVPVKKVACYEFYLCGHVN